MRRLRKGPRPSDAQPQAQNPPIVPKPEPIEFDDFSSSSHIPLQGDNVIAPKPEPLDFDFPSCSAPPGHDVASSSGSSLRSSFVAMGFLPSLVDRVIEEKGEEDTDLILETLFEYSEAQGTNTESDPHGFYAEEGQRNFFDPSTIIQPKEEVEDFDEYYIDKKASLLMMSFHPKEVEFALEKLSGDTPLNEIVDFITATQIAQQLENEGDDMCSDDEKVQGANNEVLFGTMEKTLRLIEMGFSEQEISIAIESGGSELPIPELADAIFTDQTGGKHFDSDKFNLAILTKKQEVARNSQSHIKTEDRAVRQTYEPVEANPEFQSSDGLFQQRDINVREFQEQNEAKEEYFDYSFGSTSQSREFDFEDNRKGKKPRQEYASGTSFMFDEMWLENKLDSGIIGPEVQRVFKSQSSKSVNKMVGKPPYFFFGNVVNTSLDTWNKLSSHMYGLEPEFIDSQLFSAVSRREGYIHNLPTENRFHIVPRPPMTIENAIPQTKKWWQPWDPRKQFMDICPEISGLRQVCDELGKMVNTKRGRLSIEQQRRILHQCQALNLVWNGPGKLGYLEPDDWENILGYPMNHTQAGDDRMTERLQLLKHAFQTDTLGYHLSVLKSMFPKGLTVLSIFTGIGGAEVSLHRLGIHLKGLVSVEASEAKRKILRNWWHNSRQTGDLVQLEEIQKLNSKSLENLIDRFGGFDLVICQGSYSYEVDSGTGGASSRASGLDFSSFHEYIRVLQRVRTMMERR